MPRERSACGLLAPVAAFGLGFGGFEELERAEQVGMPGLRAAARCSQQLFCGSDHLGKGHRAEAVEQGQAGVERGGHGRGLDPPAGIPPGPLKWSSVASRGAAPWPSITVTVWCLAS